MGTVDMTEKFRVVEVDMPNASTAQFPQNNVK